MKFTIRAGQHYSDGWVYRCLSALQLSRESTRLLLFEEECLYRFDGADQLDFNKLFGFSNGLDHHRYSARFGWRSTLSGKILLSAYCYIDGQRVIEEIGEVSPLQPCWATIRDRGFAYDFRLELGSETWTRSVRKEQAWRPGVQLWPYFGGNRTAPHKMVIWLC